jgi:hypothetical protein
MFQKNAITIQLTMPVPLQFCASLKNAIMYASSHLWPTCRHTRGGHASVWTKLPLLIPYHSFDMRDPHVRAFFNLSPGERERLRGREPMASRPRACSNPGCERAAPAAGSPSSGLQWLADRGRAPILAAGGLRRSRAPVASRLRVSSNHGRRRAPSAAGKLQSQPRAGSTGRGIPVAGLLHRPRPPPAAGELLRPRVSRASSNPGSRPLDLHPSPLYRMGSPAC